MQKFKSLFYLLLLTQLATLSAWETLTNDWWGMGPKWQEAGFDITASYTMDIAANVAGGRNRGWSQATSLGLNVSADMDKLACWTGWTIFNSWVFRTGSSLSKERIDNQFPVQQVYGGQNLRLNELYLMNQSQDGRMIFKAGRLDEGNDFLTSPLYCYFMNNGFCGNPISVFFNGPYTAYPNATWAAFLKFHPAKKLSVQFGLYNGDSDLSQNKYHGMDFAFHNTNGVQITTEWNYLNNQGPCTYGMPGNYKVGGLYYTGHFDKFTGSRHKGNYSYYFLFDQMIYRRKDDWNRNLKAFVTLLFAPENRNQFPFFSSSGFLYQGLFCARPSDVTALGLVWGSYSETLRRMQRAAKTTGIPGAYGIQPQNYEAVIELNHLIQVNKWLQLTPDLQYVINPKGYGTTPNAFVIGMQINLNI